MKPNRSGEEMHFSTRQPRTNEEAEVISTAQTIKGHDAELSLGLPVTNYKHKY